MFKRILDRVHKALGRSDIYFGDDLYMRRWRIGPNDGFGIRLHHIVRSDRDRELHDHPFDFVSLILWGGYTEHREDGSATFYPPGSVLHRKGETLHRLTLTRPAWTLVVRGPMRREWGFRVGDAWVWWRDFIAGKGQGDAGSEHKPAFSATSSLGVRT